MDDFTLMKIHLDAITFVMRATIGVPLRERLYPSETLRLNNFRKIYLCLQQLLKRENNMFIRI